MTYHSTRSSALDRVVNAGRADRLEDSASGQSHAWRGEHRSRPGQFFHTTLLSNVLARLPSTQKSCIQFIGCGERAASKSIALAMSTTAAAQIGKSLLLDASFRRSRDEPELGFSNEPLPDTFVPELYHLWLDKDELRLAREWRSLLSKMTYDFGFTAIDGGDAVSNSIAMMLAPLCSGTILVVRAAATTCASVKRAHSLINASGGNVIGTVLQNVPGKLSLDRVT